MRAFRFRHRFCKHAALVAAACAVAAPGLAAAGEAPSRRPGPARLAEQGNIPNFQGIWERVGGILFDPAAGGRNPQKPPLTPEYQRRYDAILAAAAAGRPVADPGALCLPAGMPRVMVMTYPMEILQSPGQVTIIAEWSSQVRRIFTDGRSHPEDPDPTYLGHSIGHWEGDTLVVDTVGIRGDTVFDSTGLGHSDKLRVTERIRLTGPDDLEDEITIHDPEAFVRPWVITRKYKRGEPGLEIMEYICQENNRNPVGPDGVTGFVLQGSSNQTAPAR